ncbi:MAG: ATP-dependent helicase UvrD/PcrA [Solirubrobacterales bacterium]|jgi:DNA helicase-2/ATP-dependent DNA helicase PcrA|nr:ATP-dependent helicase UvrD/PcrA [Solirubrobacterales bacterium]
MENLAPISPGQDAIERLLEGLNPPQQRAVEYGEGPLLVIAGAGSGKTRVLTRRIAYLVATGQAHPSEILAITFTNKAAQEMRNRVEELVGGVSRLMWVMTFHSACARLLRANAERLGYKRSFTIYDQADSLRMVKRCLEENDIDPKRFTPRSIQAAISSAKNRLEDSTDYAESQATYFEEVVAEVYSLYERRMVEASAMDFDDLLVRTVNLFELFADVRERYQRTFRWLLVDEYQDTNRAQYRLLQLLAGEQQNLTVVGDDAQSIYSFRSADVRNILEFEHDFEGAEVVKLEQNYRSTGTILDAANAVIANNTEQKQKNLWTDAGRGEPVVVAELDDEHAEARYVAGEIERLVSDEDFGRDDIAVFYRMNAQSRVLEDTLVRYEVPYQVIGGTKFYERAEVKDAVAYLSLLANPADAISFTRVINSPRRGIGQTSESRILSHVNTTGEDVWDVMSRPESVPGLGAAAVKAVSRFAAVMAGLRERAEGNSVAELLESVLHDTGYFDSLEAERTLEAEGRMENLQELVGVAGEFDINRKVEGEEREDTPLEEFLAQIRLFTEQDGIRDSESLITLMSLHNAKGLEYDAAFIIGCEEGVFPHARSVEEGNLEEERRLAYVGVTRAKQRLYMTCARRRSLHGSSGWNLPSRFLREVPDELVDKKAMAVQTGWQGARAGGSRRDTVLGFGGAGEFRAPQRPQPQTPEVEFRIGDDVVHASFGEGVVTSVEPGSVVVVRFASVGGERKLMADYAPLKKAS